MVDPSVSERDKSNQLAVIYRSPDRAFDEDTISEEGQVLGRTVETG